MVDQKNKGGGEFDDDAFDVEDFSEADFDEAAFDDDAAFDDLPAEEGEYEGDDFESEEWGEDEEGTTPGKKAKKAKQKSGDKAGLGFNTIVIIGAVVVGGGVMAVNIMSKTAEVKNAKPSMFQSILGIGGIMDGTLFGDKADEDATPEQTAAKDQAEQQQGFLNNPDTVIPSTPSGEQSGNLPQPTPITPGDTTAAENEPLTPMPTPSAEAPRGPDDAPPITPPPVPTTPALPGAAPDVAAITPPLVPEPETMPDANTPESTAVPASAEDILKQAMANRAEKAKGAQEATPLTPEPIPTSEPAKDVTITSAPEAVPVVPLPEKTAEPVVPAASKEDIEANKQAVSSLESKIDTLLKRMDQIETELGDVKQAKSSDYEQIEQTVQSLKKDLSAIKDRPAPVSSSVSSSADEASEELKPAPVRKKKAKKPAPAPVEDTTAYSDADSTPVTAPAPVKTSAKTAVVSSRWELRAAQPGRAWISKPGERDMQGVSVGQTLAGIGRVTAIIYQDGRWAVIGTQGQIRQ